MQTGGTVIKESKRLMSLDALRGFDMFMIIGGKTICTTFIKATQIGFLASLLPQFEHSTWSEKSTFYDVIMPLFLFIVGVAMPFSFSKRIEAGESKAKLYKHIFIRFAILFLLGMIRAGHLLDFDLSKLCVYNNTLQAIAAGYLIAAILMLNFNIKWQAIITAGLLLLYWALMMLVPVPGYGAGILTPEGNLAKYVDILVFGRFADKLVYAWLLSSITFGCSVMMGVFAGYLLRSSKNEITKYWLLIAGGVSCIILGLVWEIWFPIIKILWSSSMVLYLGGISLVLLAFFYLIIDIWGLRKWAFFFVVIGMNAIFAYMIGQFVGFNQIADILFSGIYKWTGNWAAFVKSTTSFMILWLMLYYMYRHKTFVKI